MGTTRPEYVQAEQEFCDERSIKPKAMPDAARARLYRKRQRERGLVAVKGHLEANTHAYLHALRLIHQITMSQAIDLAVGCLMRGQDAPMVRSWHRPSGYPCSHLPR